jgi:processive 1,2-diacylglycerol beta-glucosyltransferase
VRSRRPQASPPDPDQPLNVLIISASMGAGHDGAARNLAAQVHEQGHAATVKDFLDSGPLRIGAALRSGYEFELKHVPSAYDATYRLWYQVPWLCPIVAWLVTVLTRRRVMRWISDAQANVVVSTYPLATLCLGRLRWTGRLTIPAVNFITDFGVHPLWVHKGIDLNLAVHQGPALMARNRTARPSVACGPVVSPRFDPAALPPRPAAREALGLDGHRAVLVVAGSWGVGDVESTWSAITASGEFTPVVVCGRDDHLLARVKALADSYQGDSVVLGWTDDMPRLVAACDALVENAGGLTSLEAMKAGLPVVSFHPIAGHGKENTARMAEAGVSQFARDESELTAALQTVTTPGPARDAQIARGQAMFQSLPADLVVSASATPVPRPIRQPALTVVRVAAAVTALALLGWLGLTSGVAIATEAGAGVAHPAPDTGPVAYIGVRLNGAQLADAGVVSAIRQMGLTAVVDDRTAVANSDLVRTIAAQGINLENGGMGDPPRFSGGDKDLFPWTRARSDAQAGRRLQLLIDRPVTVTVPGRRLTAWDLIECRDAHMSLVVPNHILNAQRLEPSGVIRLSAKRIYLINGLAATPAQLEAYLSQLSWSLHADHLRATSLATLT